MNTTPVDAHTNTETSARKLGVFEVQRYRADGWYSVPSLMQISGALAAAGIGLGVVAAFIGQYFWLIVLFPMAIGFAMGGVGTLLVNKFHIRNPWICALAGLCAGVFAMLAMHFTNFRLHEAAIREYIEPSVLKIVRGADANGADVPEEIQDLIRNLRGNPAFWAAVQVDSFPKFMDYKAIEGVEIRGKRGRRANLGYSGTWMYWGFEIFLVAGVALALMKSASEQPYCAEAHAWKPCQKIGPFLYSPEQIDLWKRGELCVLTPADDVSQPTLMIHVYPSPGQESEQPVDLFLERLTYDKNGKARTKTLAKLTYPGKSYLPLLAACSMATSSAESSAGADSAAEG